MDYQVPLLVLENDKVVEVPLIEVYNTSNGLDHEIMVSNFEKYREDNIEYSLYTLNSNFIDCIKKMHEKFEPVVSDRTDYNLLERILSTPVTFATKEAYARKREEENLTYEDTSIGCFDRDEGIFISLHTPLASVRGTIIHEYGHALNFELEPQKYDQSTLVMKELVAIFVQEHFGIIKEYYEHKIHHKAQRILHNLYDTPFNDMSFTEQWDLLTSIVNHKLPKQER